MEEKDIERILRQGFPLPGEASRDDLLQRCLALIDEADVREIADEELEMLAAAGQPFPSVDIVPSNETRREV